jgi:excisionase family DNA binding protein
MEAHYQRLNTQDRRRAMEQNLVFENLPSPTAEPLFTFQPRSAGSGKDEGRDPPVSRAKSRHSESGRQDLNLGPLGPEGSTPGSDTIGSDPMPADVLGITGLAARPRSDTWGPERSVVPAPGTIQAQRTVGTSILLTVAEVASRVRVSRATVYRLVAEGRLPAVRVSSGAIRIVLPNDR